MLKKKNRRLVRLYIDVEKGFYYLLPFTDSKKKLELPVTIESLAHAKRGYPWECWVAQAITKFAKENPDSFSHPVLFVYVIRSAIYIVDRYKNGQPSHAVRYFHDFGPITKKFDKLPKKKFLKAINGSADDLVLKMRPAKHGGHVEPRKGRRATRDMENPVSKAKGSIGGVKAVSRGAMLRAKDAGLIPQSA